MEICPAGKVGFYWPLRYTSPMNLLPVADRELRVASRKRSTFWLRVAAAATALVVGSGCLLLESFTGTRVNALGTALFTALTWMCLVAALSAGLFLTSDCLSEEKREGTLGLLFLTELRGYDVVLGKLAATSLRGFYALLAVLPILAITELVGGITGAQYWKTSLTLLNALFCSLAAGMFISSLSRDSQKALAGTLLLVLVFTCGGLVVDWIISQVSKRPFDPVWSLSSPAYLMITANAWGRAPFWDSLWINQVLGWTFFVAACVFAPQTWSDKKRSGATTNRGWAYAWKYGSLRLRQRRRRLLDTEPIAWLTSRERWQSLAIWCLALLVGSGFVFRLLHETDHMLWMIWSYVGGLFMLLIYIGVASQASRFLVQVRRSGFLELLLVSPVDDKEIVRGQWRGWLRLFAIPLALLLLVHVGGTVLAQLSMHKVMATAMRAATTTNQTAGARTIKPTSTSSGMVVTVTSTSGTNTVTTPNLLARPDQLAVALASGLVAAVGTAANLVALAWFGLWMGLTSRSANLATLKTLVFVEVIPAFVIAFGAGMIAALCMIGLFSKGGSPSGNFIAWFPLVSSGLSATLAVIKDAGFIAWSRKRLFKSFREQAARSLDHPALITPPVIEPALHPQSFNKV
jgi:hypothetical protein